MQEKECECGKEDRFITDREIMKMLSVSRSWPWKLAQDGRFPSPIRLSNRCTRWRLSEVERWMKNPTGWSEK